MRSRFTGTSRNLVSTELGFHFEKQDLVIFNKKVLDGCLGKEDIGRETARNAMGKNETF